MRRYPKSTRPPVDKATTQSTSERLKILRRRDSDARIWPKRQDEVDEDRSSIVGRVPFGRRRNADEEDWQDRAAEIAAMGRGRPLERKLTHSPHQSDFLVRRGMVDSSDRPRP